MKIYCLDVSTTVSDFCGLVNRRIVSTKSAVNDYVIELKKRIFSVVSKKPYLRDHEVFISVFTKEPNDVGVFVVVQHYTLVLKLNSDDSFSTYFIR